MILKVRFKLLLLGERARTGYWTKDQFLVLLADARAGREDAPERRRNTPAMDILFDGSGDDGIACEMAELELALLRRGVDQRAAGRECCSRCGRTPLLGERVYTLDEGGTWVCELCRAVGGGQALGSRVVHGPAFGHSIRIVDQRAA